MSGVKAERWQIEGLTLDRRTFLWRTGLAAGAMVAATLAPLSLAERAELSRLLVKIS